MPRRELFAVIEREGLQKGIWARIGTAFQNKDGSWNLKFDLLSARSSTTIQMRTTRVLRVAVAAKQQIVLAVRFDPVVVRAAGAACEQDQTERNAKGC